MKTKYLLLIGLGVLLFSGIVTASTLYYSKDCPHCQKVLNSGQLFKIDNLKMCPLSDKDCLSCYKKEGLKGVPGLITGRQSIGGSNNIINYAKNQPYFSKMPSKEDKRIGTHKINNKKYELWETPEGERFLGSIV